jgi:hypothetical protein
MSLLNQRITELTKLRKDLMEGSPDRKLTVFSYIQLLDYHLALLTEVDTLVDAMRDGNKESVADWYSKRVKE